ncbi:MAG TPA: 50S ribosomal protein L9, partial [Rhizobiales bacterium]|nr:50S ribosomal protein L9 [Hyphomicrobiales bacterium]
TLGLHEVRVQLHAEVEPRITVNVARSPDEAARQARGEDVSSKAMSEAEEEAEAAKVAAAALFEEGAPAEITGEEKADEELSE